VVGIVLFGSINSGIESEMDLARLKGLWGRANWLLYFIVMSITLILVYIFTSQLESILSSRADISAEPFSGQAGRGVLPAVGKSWRRRVANSYGNLMNWVKEKLEAWTAAKDDKTIAWTLGIGWACCGGGLAGGCLVFAKAT
jgi:magnesium transporter